MCNIRAPTVGLQHSRKHISVLYRERSREMHGLSESYLKGKGGGILCRVQSTGDSEGFKYLVKVLDKSDSDCP